jgi:hypothetical protein
LALAVEVPFSSGERIMAETNELMKRPLASDELVKARTWEILEPKVKSYLGADWIESEAPHIQKQIMRVLSPSKDGYGMARELERDGWEEDRGLVDLMDAGESDLRDAHKELVKQWIAVYGIAPSRSVGDVVSTAHWRHKGQIGTITNIREDEATYAVHFPDQSATSAQILLYEEVVDVPEAHS